MGLVLDRVFLDYSARKLIELAERIEICLDRLSEDQIWVRGNEAENAIGNLVLHLCGNVRQWILSAIGGESDSRVRTAEFSARGGTSKAELQGRLRSTVDAAVAVLSGLSSNQLAGQRVIQGYDVTVLEAIYHVVEHFSMHAGQIICLTKMMTGNDLGFYRHLDSAASPKNATP
jgi:uncharacterized damage-inducible protein DinB